TARSAPRWAASRTRPKMPWASAAGLTASVRRSAQGRNRREANIVVWGAGGAAPPHGEAVVTARSRGHAIPSHIFSRARDAPAPHRLQRADDPFEQRLLHVVLLEQHAVDDEVERGVHAGAHGGALL